MTSKKVIVYITAVILTAGIFTGTNIALDNNYNRYAAITNGNLNSNAENSQHDTTDNNNKAIKVKQAVQNVSYENELFGDEIITIDIIADENTWQNIISNTSTEKSAAADVNINGTLIQNVGIYIDDTGNLKIKFDKYVDNQTCYGLDNLVLSNINSDDTYMKDYISSDMMKFMGVNSSLCNYSYISVNGKYWGFYSASEAYEKSFLNRTCGNENSSVYNNDSQKIESALEKISANEDMEKYFDTDQIIRYFAVRTALSDYSGSSSDEMMNYCVYENNGVLSILPCNDSADENSDENYLMEKILDVDKYRKKYNKYLQEIANEYFKSGYFSSKIDETDSKISRYIEECYPDNNYKTAVDTLKSFGEKNSENIKKKIIEKSSDSYNKNNDLTVTDENTVTSETEYRPRKPETVTDENNSMPEDGKQFAEDRFHQPDNNNNNNYDDFPEHDDYEPYHKNEYKPDEPFADNPPHDMPENPHYNMPEDNFEIPFNDNAPDDFMNHQ